MSPEANNQPTQDEAPKDLITDMSKELETGELLEAGKQEPLLEVGEPKIVDASDIPAGDEATSESVSEAVEEQPSSRMNEYGGNRITSPTPEQVEKNMDIMKAAAASLRTSDDSGVSPVHPYVQNQNKQ